MTDDDPMRPTTQLFAMTRANRHDVTTGIDDLVAELGGWIEGHVLYSNTMTVFRLVISAEKTPALAAGLAALHVTLAEPDHARLADLASASPPEDEIPLSLQLTFIHDEPELKREVPAVPG